MDSVEDLNVKFSNYKIFLDQHGIDRIIKTKERKIANNVREAETKIKELLKKGIIIPNVLDECYICICKVGFLRPIYHSLVFRELKIVKIINVFDWRPAHNVEFKKYKIEKLKRKIH